MSIKNSKVGDIFQSFLYKLDYDKSVGWHPLKRLFAKKEKENAIFEAIDTHNMQKLIFIVTSNYKSIQSKNENNLTPLMRAVVVKNYGAISYLIRSGIDINAVDNDGWSALSWAVFLKDEEAIKLLQSSAMIKSNDTSGIAFYFATQKISI